MQLHQLHLGAPSRSTGRPPAGLDPGRRTASGRHDVSAAANTATIAVLNGYLISHSILITAVVALVVIALALALRLTRNASATWDPPGRAR